MDWKAQARRFGPQMGRRPWRDVARSSLGAGAALLICAAALRAMPHARETGLYLVSGFGAMSVLLFVLPNSPLAQPWSAFVGMITAPTVAITVLQVVPPPFADGLAIAAAIAAMLALRALHPPAAGMALLAVLDYEAGQPLGYDFVLMPVAAVSLALIGLAMLWNNAFGVPYPAAAASATPAPSAGPIHPADRAPIEAQPLTLGDIDAILLEQNQSANVVASEVLGLVNEAARRSTRALLERTTVGQIMTPSPTSIRPDLPLSQIVAEMVKHGVKSLPVTAADGRLLGMVDHHDAMARLAQEFQTARRRMMRLGAAPPEPNAAALMRADLTPVSPDAPVGDLLSRLRDFRSRALPVVAEGRLVGLVSRSDLVALMLAQTPGAGPGADHAEEAAAGA